MGAYWQGSTGAAQPAFFDNAKVTVAQPTISVTGGPLSFPNTSVGSNSASQSYNVSGSDLTANLVVTAPSTDFQVSTDNTNFFPSVSLTPSSGTVASTQIFVRFTPQSEGALGGNVTNASTGATTQNVAVSGTGVPVLNVTTDPTVTEGNAGPTLATFNVTLTPASSQTVTVHYSTQDSTATTADNDYVAITDTLLTFNPGETSKNIDVTVNGDTQVEPNEQFFFNINTPSNANISDNQGVGTITNDDMPSLSIDDVTHAEGNAGTTAYTFTVTKTGSGAATVDYATANGSAVSASDYTAISATTLSFTSVETTKQFTVFVNGDTTVEPSEAFFVNLSNASGATIADGQGVGLIVTDDVGTAGGKIAFRSNRDGNPSNNEIYVMNADGTNQINLTNNPASDDEPAFSPDGSQIAFYSDRDGNFEIYVMNADGTNQTRLTNNAANDFSPAFSPDGNKIAFYSDRDGNAEIYVMNADGTGQARLTNNAAVDFFPAFSPGGSQIAFSSVRDNNFEVYVMNADGTNQTNLTNNGAFDGYPTWAVGNVPSFTIDDVTHMEGNSGTTAYTFTVTKTGSGAASVQFTTVDGTATVADNDYTTNSGTLNFAAADVTQTITVLVNGDTTFESDEAFTVHLSNPAGAAIADADGTGTIQNDEAETSVSVSGGVLTISDGNGGTSNDTLTITKSGNDIRISDPNNTLSAGAGANQVNANTVDVPNVGLTSIQVNTLGGNDALTIALANGNFFPSGGIAYAGGAQTTSDKLFITGGAQGLVTYNYTNANDGSVVMQNFGTVSYTGLEPISNTGTATNIIFNLPAGPNAATLADDGTSANTLSRLSGATFETTDFANPTGSLTVNRGNASDTLTVDALPDFNAALTLGSGPNPFSTITFTGGVTLAADKDLDGFASGTINLSNAAADLATTGTGSVHLVTARNITLATGSSVNVVDGTLQLSANNMASVTSGDFNGIDIIGATLQTTGTGFVNLTGRGGSGDFIDNLGIQLAAGGQILGTNNTSDTANMSIYGIGGEGTGSATAGTNNVGVYVTGNNSLINSTSAIQVTGEGGATTNSGSYGVVVDGLGKIQVSGPGALTVNGTGGLVTGGGATFVNSAGIFVVAGAVPSEGGSIVSTGTGANAGNINLIGVADNGGAGAAQGVRVDSPGTVTSVDGAINIDGTSAPCGGACLGTSIRGFVMASGTGAINLTGTGANSTGVGPTHGVNVRSGGNVVAKNGDITVTGTGGNTTDNAGFNLAPVGGGILQIAVTGTGDIFVNADTIVINPVAGNATITAGASNAVTLRQKTNGVAINLGSGVDSTANTLELSDGELDRVISTGTLNLGNTNSGAITVSASITRPASTVLNLTSGANIDIATGSLNSGGGNVTLSPNTNVFPSNSGVDVNSGAGTLALTSAKDLKIVINNTTVDTGYTQLNVAGLVNLNGANLALSGSHMPTGGQSFIIVSNDGADAVSGTFNGLPQGATIPAFLGSALNATISYTGGDGNDVVLTTAPTCVASLVVNDAGDAVDAVPGDGACATSGSVCTLRAAIQETDALSSCPGVISINFNIAGAGVHTISPISALPDVTRPVTIDGYTQPGSSVNTLITSDNAVLRIELDGTSAGPGMNGLTFTSTATGSTVRGLVINRFARDGISLNGAQAATITGNFIGTDATGLFDLGNGGRGIEGEFFTGISNSVIGGTTPAARNIIAGNNSFGFEFSTSANVTIQGNFIGLGADGSTAVGNGAAGVSFGSFTSNTVIGGDDAADGVTDGNVGARNYVAGNGGPGLFLGNPSTVRGNYIGTDATGTLARPNLLGIDNNLAHNSVIGGTSAGAGNLISGNTTQGISLSSSNLVITGNLIGTKADGTSALGNGLAGIYVNNGVGAQIGGAAAGEANTIAFNGGDGVDANGGVNNSIRGNSIHDNGGGAGTLGIDLNNDGVSANDAADGDSGANNTQNFPVITSATSSGGVNTIDGTLNSTPGQTFTIDFYTSPSCDSSGNGEGQTYLGSVTTGTTDGSGNVAFTYSPATLNVGDTVTATATDSSGNTSEFSTCGVVTAYFFRSAASGNWNANSTWEQSSDGVMWTPATSTPNAASNFITVRSPHTVTVTANVDADQLTVDNGGTISVNNGVTFTIADEAGTDMTVNGTVATAGNITNNGQVVINNTLRIDQGGFPGGGTGTYSYDQVNATLVFNNTSGSFGVNNVNFWPTTNGPQNVNVAGAGGITMNVARTVGLLFQYAAGVSNANNLTLNGTSQVNNGGFTSGSPTYGASSLLKYNVNASYGRNGEWLPNVTSGAGYPANVQLSNNTNLDLPNGSSGVFFQMAGNLTIDAGSTMNLNGSPAMTQPLGVLGNVTIAGTLTLSSASGGDIKVGGNWTRTGTFNANGRAVNFNGTGTQTIALGSAGVESFAYLIVDKASGDLTFSSSPATSVIVNSPGGGSALQIINEGGINLNGNGLTLSGSVAGTNILVGGATASATRNVIGTGTFNITNGAKSVTNNNGKTLTFGTGVNVSLFQPMDFGASLTTINGTLTIGGGGSVNTNAPTYGSASTLVYDCTCVYSRSTEWSATSGPGYPNNVTVNSGTDVNIGGSSPSTARQIAGSLDAKSGGRFLLDFPGSEMTAALTVLSNVLIESGGSLNLSTVSGGDLKVQGNFTNNGTFTPNNRAVFFEGGATQTVNASSGSLSMPYVRINKSGGTVQLGNTDLTTLGPSGGNSITFTGSTSTLSINGRTLTLGATLGTPPAGSGFVGSSTSTLSLQDGGTNGAMGTFAFTGDLNLGTLTINRTGTSPSATLGSNLTVNSTLNLTSGDINTGANVIEMPSGATSTGTGDVVGNVRRTGFTNGPALTNAKSFGNPNNQISFQTGTAPADITVNLAKSVPTGTGFGYPGAVQRTYTITPNGGSGFTATLRLHYLDAELNGNTEALLDFWRFNGTVWQRIIKTPIVGQDLTNNWIESNLVTQFSPWTLAQGNALTESRLASFNATQYDAGTVLSWQTGFEVDNLGFNLYREVAGRRTLVNSSLIAGSALVTGPSVAMTAGNTYTWTDYVGGASARYYLEEVDLAGNSKTYGPFTTTRVSGRGVKGIRSPVISGLTDGAPAQDTQHQWMRTDAARTSLTRAGGGASNAAQEKQRWLASQAAVKIGVRALGWYRVTHEQLTAAGLNPAADPTRLQLYVGGVEVPIRVGADGSVEFYGQGLDVQSTDTRVYWLVEGNTAGLRTSASPVTTSGGDDTTGPGGDTTGGETDGGQTNGTPIVNEVPIGPSPNGPEFFNYTVERRDRNVYFSGLQNGEAENFFGKVVNATAGTQTLTVRNLLQLDAQNATLEVALQGLTAGEHHVSVSFNGIDLGTLDFAGQTNKTVAFNLEGYMLHEGDNQVQLVAVGSGDVSLTDRLRLTYLHSMNADDDRLRFNAPGGFVRLGGFSSPAVRVIDVTDPGAPFEVQIAEDAVLDSQGNWSVRFNVAGGERELFAFIDAQASQPASVLANTPSTWSTDAGQQADMVVIAHGNFKQQVAPLVAQRTAEGLNVKVVDVEDLFDEFSYGAHTPQAVRDFLAWTKANWEKAPAYVLLVGDGSYDPRDYLARGRYDLVPSKLVDAGAMETASDDWFADFDDDGIADVALGRLPVRTPAEASTVVNKIVTRTVDPTQTSALMVSDRNGPDGYNFEVATDGVQALLPSGTNVSRVNRGTQDAATVRSQIVAGVNSGPLVVNWMGHGSIDVWTGDGLLRGSDAPSLQNGSRLPLFVMMTCLNGYYEGTGLDSLAESVLKAEQGGAYAVWASSGMTEPNAQVEANRELYRIIFVEGGTVRLGDAVRRAKTATADRDVRRTWVFFGDPSSTLR